MQDFLKHPVKRRIFSVQIFHYFLLTIVFRENLFLIWIFFYFYFFIKSKHQTKKKLKMTSDTISKNEDTLLKGSIKRSATTPRRAALVNQFF